MDQTDIQLTGFLVFPVALIGVIINWTALYILRKSPAFRHSFGYLSSSQTIADAINSTLFLIYFCPMVIWDIQLLKDYSLHCGFLLYMCFEISVQTHFVISINRWFAVWTPFKYAVWFSNRNTKRIITLIFIFSFSDTFVVSEVLCNFYYDPTAAFFSFTPTDFCDVIGIYDDLYKHLTIICTIVVIDISTIFKLQSVRKQLVTSVDLQSSRVSKREINFLKQTVSQGAVFALANISYYLVPMSTSNPWAVFFGTSFSWVTVDVLNGLILIVFNPEFKKFIVTRAISQQVSTGGALDSVIPKINTLVS